MVRPFVTTAEGNARDGTYRAVLIMDQVLSFRALEHQFEDQTA
jgi:hypothetical protein